MSAATTLGRAKTANGAGSFGVSKSTKAPGASQPLPRTQKVHAMGAAKKTAAKAVFAVGDISANRNNSADQNMPAEPGDSDTSFGKDLPPIEFK